MTQGSVDTVKPQSAFSSCSIEDTRKILEEREKEWLSDKANLRTSIKVQRAVIRKYAMTNKPKALDALKTMKMFESLLLRLKNALATIRKEIDRLGSGQENPENTSVIRDIAGLFVELDRRAEVEGAVTADKMRAIIRNTDIISKPMKENLALLFDKPPTNPILGEGELEEELEKFMVASARATASKTPRPF